MLGSLNNLHDIKLTCAAMVFSPHHGAPSYYHHHRNYTAFECKPSITTVVNYSYSIATGSSTTRQQLCSSYQHD